MTFMKKEINKFLIITAVTLLSMFGMTGCGVAPEEIQTEFLDMLQAPASEESIDSIAVFLDANLKYMDEENADNMVISFEDYAYAFDPEYLRLDELAERYESYISEALVKLYELRAVEQQNPMSNEAKLQISWQELFDRALKTEDYIKTYKDVKSVKQDALWLYGNYINAMIMGTTGTPTFDYDTGNFNQETLIAYYDVTEKNPGTTVQWTIDEYILYLEDVRYNLDYNDAKESKAFFDTCTYLVSEAGKRVYQ